MVSQFSSLLPFSNTAKNEIDLYDVEEVTSHTVLLRGFERIKSGVEEDKIPEITASTRSTKYADSEYTYDEIELLSYSAARILISLVNDNRIISRYASSEAARSRQHLEEETDEILHKICSDLNIDIETYDSLSECDTLVEYIGDNVQTLDGFKKLCEESGIIKQDIQQLEEAWSNSKYDVRNFLKEQGSDGQITVAYDSLVSIPVETYAELSQFTNEDKFKLSNQFVYSGQVLINRGKLLDILQVKFNDLAREGIPMDVPSWIAEDDDVINAVDLLTNTISEEYFSIEVDEVNDVLFPPCMDLILEEIAEGVNLGHDARFAIASFLINLGLSNEEIVEMFGMNPEFTPDATKYQLNHIRGDASDTEYTAPSCDTMVSNGLCRNKDNLCEKISHPLSYYQVKYLSEYESHDESDGE